jgi:hypothetical protein
MTRFNVDHHRPRLEGDLHLGTRLAAAVLSERHPDQISRHVEPIACDVETRLALYDLAEVEAAVSALKRRVA